MVSSHYYSLIIHTDSAENFSDAFFEDVARVLEVDHVPLVDAPTLSNAGKIPTAEAELETAVDESNTGPPELVGPVGSWPNQNFWQPYLYPAGFIVVAWVLVLLAGRGLIAYVLSPFD